jgi:hypothetical protein
MSSKAASARRTPSRTRTRAPLPPGLFCEEFSVKRQRYRWSEGEGIVTDAAALRDAARRSELPGLFTRAVVPQLERRGARGLVYPAAAPEGMGPGDLRWVAWQAPGDGAPVWGLYVAGRHLVSAEQDAPANDTFVLIAWGDGPALAWADERAEARTVLRAALHWPPEWLAAGMRSRDVTFPVRLDRVGAPARGSAAAPCVAVLRPRVEPMPSTEPAAPEALLALVQSWKRQHGREPFTP